MLANLEPGPQGTWVNYRNAARPPLLFISGGEDHLMPPVVQHSNDDTLRPVVNFMKPAPRGSLTKRRA